MKSLYNTLKESLLSGFDEIEASMDPKKEIEQFLKSNYNISRIKISDEPNGNGRYVVNCIGDIKVKNKNITSLTNSLFEWGIVNHFSCSFCTSLTSLEGAPEEVKGSFDCSNCNSLTSLEGAPKKVGWGFYCNNCRSLKSLKGTPKKVGGDFDCSNCYALTSLEGVPKAVSGNFYCSHCKTQWEIEDIEAISKIKGIIFL